MNIYQIHPFNGLNIDIAPRYVDAHNQVVANNILYENGRIFSRDALRSYDAQDIGDVLYIHEYTRLTSVQRDCLLFTKTDIYYYNVIDKIMSIVTPRYITGTVSVSDTTVNLSGGEWSTSYPGNQYYIGFGSTDPNDITTWYKITSFDSTTSCTLEVSPGNISNSLYCIRMCFSPSTTDWSVATVTFTDMENSVIATNLYDCPVIWHGPSILGRDDGFFEFINIDNYTFRAKYVAATKSRVVFGYTMDGGVSYPTTVRVSVANNPIDFSNAFNIGLFSTPSSIIGMFVLGETLYVMKEDGITSMTPTYSETTVFSYDENRIQIDGINNKCVAVYDNFVILACKNGVYYFDGNLFQSISDGYVSNYIKANYEVNHRNNYFTIADKDNKRFYFFMSTQIHEYPIMALCFDIRNKSWSKYILPVEIKYGRYITYTNQITYQSSIDAGTTYNDYTNITGMQLIDMTTVQKALFFVRNIDDTTTEILKSDATEITDLYNISTEADINCCVETADMPLNNEAQAVLLREIIIGYKGLGDASIVYQVSIDGGETWSNEYVVDISSTNEYNEVRIATYFRGKRIRVRIKNYNSSKFYIENVLLKYDDAGFEL